MEVLVVEFSIRNSEFIVTWVTESWPFQGSFSSWHFKRYLNFVKSFSKCKLSNYEKVSTSQSIKSSFNASVWILPLLVNNWNKKRDKYQRYILKATWTVASRLGALNLHQRTHSQLTENQSTSCTYSSNKQEKRDRERERERERDNL